MPTVKFSIGSHTYDLACAEGEERKIQLLAANVNTRVNNLAGKFQSGGDHMVLAIASLLMEDEITALRESVAKSQQNKAITINTGKSDEEAIEKAVISAIEPVTKYIESLADSLETV